MIAIVGRAVALELADDRAVVHVVRADHPAPFRQHAPVDPVVALAVDDRVHRPMAVQQHTVAAAPVRQGLVRGEADDQVVDHDDRRALLGVLGSLEHLLDVGRGDVQVVALALAGLLLGLADGLGDEAVAIAPTHERLGVDVLVVLGEVEAPAEALVDGPAVVLGGQPELRLDRRAQDRTAVLVEHVPLHLDPVRRSVERLHVGDGDPQVLEPQRPDRLEPEHVADDRGRHVRDRPLLEQVHVVGDVGDVLVVPPGTGSSR